MLVIPLMIGVFLALVSGTVSAFGEVDFTKSASLWTEKTCIEKLTTQSSEGSAGERATICLNFQQAAKNTSDIARQQEQLAEDAKQIKEQKDLIAKITSDVTDQNEQITKNTSDIASQAELVTKNTSELTEQKEQIKLLTSQLENYQKAPPADFAFFTNDAIKYGGIKLSPIYDANPYTKFSMTFTCSSSGNDKIKYWIETSVDKVNWSPQGYYEVYCNGVYSGASVNVGSTAARYYQIAVQTLTAGTRTNTINSFARFSN